MTSSADKRQKVFKTCWGQLLAGGLHAPAEPTSAAFRQRFCSTCQRDGLLIPASRVRTVDRDRGVAPYNTHGGGVYNEPHTTGRQWPAHRLINQTQGCVGPRLVILRDETANVLPGLSPILCAPGSLMAFRVSRTLQPLPAQLVASGPHIGLPPPPLLPTPPLVPPPPLPPPQEPPPLLRASSSEPSSSMPDGVIGELEGMASVAGAVDSTSWRAIQREPLATGSRSSAPVRGAALSQAPSEPSGSSDAADAATALLTLLGTGPGGDRLQQ